MIRSGFLSASDRKEMLGCVKSQTEEHGIARRANALLLLDDGVSCADIAKALYLDDDTVRRWHKQYQTGGWDFVVINDWKGGQPRMTAAQETALTTWLEGRFCRSADEIRAHIAGEFGLRYSHSGCIKLLSRLGFEYRKPRPVPRVADPAQQADFIAAYARLLNGLGADEAVYFADAVHPEYQSKPAFGWVKRGAHPTLKTTPGRGRVNIHGALNLENFDAPFVEPTTVDGQSAVQLLAKIEARAPDKSTIHVIWDNAPYHRGPDVRAFLSRPDCRINLIALPPYCPHLNPIERLWKVMHEHVTYNTYYPNQKQFAAAILAFFRETIPKKWHQFRDQVTDNFRVISNQNVPVLG